MSPYGFSQHDIDIMPKRCRMCDSRSCDCMGTKSITAPTEAQIKQILRELGKLLNEKKES